MERQIHQRRMVHPSLYLASALALALLATAPAMAQENCRQHYDVQTGKVYYGCEPAKPAPPPMSRAAQIPTEWDAEPQGHPAAPAPNPLLAQWEELHRRAWGDTRLDDAVAALAAQLKAQNWCH